MKKVFNSILFLLTLSENAFGYEQYLLEGGAETITIVDSLSSTNCADANTLRNFETKNYQAKAKLRTAHYLSKRVTKVSCEDGVINFEGTISESNIKRLMDIIDFNVINWNSLTQKTLAQAGFPTNGPLFLSNPSNIHFNLAKNQKTQTNCSNPKKIIISSEGGDLTAALKLYSIVSQLNLEVQVQDSGICMSACTHLPLFAKDFNIGEDSLFMFHRPHISGVGTIEKLIILKDTPEKEAANNRVRAFWGFDDNFSETIKINISRFGDFFINSKSLESVDYPKNSL